MKVKVTSFKKNKDGSIELKEEKEVEVENNRQDTEVKEKRPRKTRKTSKKAD